MKPSPFNEKQQKWIEENYKKTPAQEVADKFGVKRYQVYTHIVKYKLGKKKKRAKVIFLKDGIFDYEKKSNWII